MQYLLPPIGKEHWVSVKMPNHPQVEKNGEGLFLVDNDFYADQLVNEKGFRRASMEVLAKGSSVKSLGKKPKDEDEEETDDFKGMTKVELKGWLDERGVDYPPKAKREDLLELCEEAVAKKADDEENED